MIHNILSDQLYRRLESLESGSLELTTPDGKTRVFEGKKPGEKADIKIHDWRVVSNLARKGDIGFAEDYRNDNWASDDVSSLVTLALANRNALQSFVVGQKLNRLGNVLSYMLRLNTVKGSRKNIHAHYDIGNEFYKLWLDPTMTYSSAIFKSPSENLVAAQHNKYDRIIDCMDTNSGRLLEVGCGWGGFADRALQQGDYDIKGITLSEEQHDYATDLLGQNANIVLEDYRHQQGKYDHLVSIEMFEAVGERFWPVYFNKVKELLAEKGKAVIQTITINEQDFDDYRMGGDFIRTYIFPGGMLPSPSKFRQQAAKAGLRVNDEYYFGQDYARTLDSWLKSFDAKKEEIKNMGFDDGFIRLWRFYLAACSAGFKTGRTDVMQVEMAHAR